MTDVELRDELITLLTAGHETTATALSWAFERLMRTPRVMGRAVEAADAGDDAYLDALGKEVLRLRPVVADVARKLMRDEEVGGYDGSRGHAAAAGDHRAPPPPRPVGAPAGAAARALHRRPAHAVLLDPVRRRDPALHRRGVRADGDAGGAAGGAAAGVADRPCARAPSGRACTT